MISPPFALLPLLVAIEVVGCPAETGERIERLVALEIGQVGTATLTLSGLRVRCDGARADLMYDSGLRRVSRQLELTPVAPAARARLIALALVELGQLDRLRARPVRPRVVASEAPLPRPVPFTQLRLSAGAGAAGVTQPGSLGGFASVDLRARFGPTWGLRGGLSGSFADKSVALGRLSMVSTSIGLAALARLPIGDFEVELGAGARVGYAWLDGQPESANVDGAGLSGGWFGPLLTAGLLVPVAEGLRLGVELEGGLPLTGVVGRVDGAPELGVEGPWLNAALLVHFDL